MRVQTWGVEEKVEEEVDQGVGDWAGVEEDPAAAGWVGEAVDLEGEDLEGVEVGREGVALVADCRYTGQQ